MCIRDRYYIIKQLSNTTCLLDNYNRHRVSYKYFFDNQIHNYTKKWIFLALQNLELYVYFYLFMDSGGHNVMLSKVANNYNTYIQRYVRNSAHICFYYWSMKTWLHPNYNLPKPYGTLFYEMIIIWLYKSFKSCISLFLLV